MKLRIKGNSIRLRLTRPEVEAVGRGSAVEEATRFPGGGLFRYRLVLGSDDAGTTAQFGDGELTVRLAQREATLWSDGPAVGIERSLPLANGSQLRILIEKDFECLHPSPGETADGTYPNPARCPGS